MNELEITARLAKFRQGIEAETGDQVVNIPSKVGFILLDVCEALELNEINLSEVVGPSMEPIANDRIEADSIGELVNTLSAVNQEARPGKIVRPPFVMPETKPGFKTHFPPRIPVSEQE